MTEQEFEDVRNYFASVLESPHTRLDKNEYDIGIEAARAEILNQRWGDYYADYPE